MKTIEGIPLIVYRSSAKNGMVNNTYRIQRGNIWVILAYMEELHNINSRKVTCVQTADSLFIGQQKYDNARKEAELLAGNPKEFLVQAVGTADKRTKKYKDFVKICEQYKVFIMKKKMREANENR